MVFWLLAIAATAIACAALYYAAAARAVNAGEGVGDAATETHFRMQLSAIGADVDAGRLLPGEADDAKREVAREYLRATGGGGGSSADARDPFSRWALLPIGLVVVMAFAAYGALGRPDLPAQPLADRPEVRAQNLDLEAAVARIEQQLAQTPDDVRGWTVIAPAYMQMGRFADAEHAYRRILELSPATADTNADLAEAMLMQNGGDMTGEPLALFQAALELDPNHARSRFYLAGEATQAGRFEEARQRWTELLSLAKGDESWLTAARQGLATAEAGLNSGGAAVPDQAQITAMVESLSQRLMQTGGTVAEWTQLVRSRLVLKDQPAAQAAYDAAVKAYPNPGDRTELDELARSGGLQLKGTSQ